MDAIADPQTGLVGQVVNDGPPLADGPEEGEGGSPYLTLDGFAGPLDHLLTLARAQRIDIAGISLVERRPTGISPLVNLTNLWPK